MFFGKRFSGYHRGTLSGLDILVLSMIKSKTGTGITGYDLIQKINKKFKGLWKASAGTIYPLLSRLTKKELVNIEELIENNRLKKTYKISENGIKELKKVLVNNLEPSINTLGDYIQTIIKAIPSFSCFPFPGMPEHCMVIPEIKGNINEYNRVKMTINKFKRINKSLEKKMNNIEEKIRKYEEILKKIEKKRNKKAIPIEIVEDEDEFKKF